MKPSIPKGTRDFGPAEMCRRNYIFNTIKQVFNLFGFSQIETPALETLATLMGKYGEEGDKLLFKILNSGDFLKDMSPERIAEGDYRKIIPAISEKGLRYDLTVPFARYVVMHRDELQMPFKRFQIQPVWRADRPQRGRYTEVYQCDADAVGSDSLWNEIKLFSMIESVFSRLRIRTVVKINNRKILSGIAEMIGAPDKIVDITVAIDKIDKIGIENVNEELRTKGIDEAAIKLLQPLLTMQGSNEEKLATLGNLLSGSEIGLAGVDELKTVVEGFDKLGHNCEAEIDVSLARGLNYYTGTIIEVKALDVQIGSITGGGRYDNLTGVFGMPGLSGVGISFGADRIYDVLNQLNLYPEDVKQSVNVMFVNFGGAEALESARLVKSLREEGIACEMYPDSAKMKKQIGYADSEGIPFVAIVGETELNNGTVNLKELATGNQATMTPSELILKFKK